MLLLIDNYDSFTHNLARYFVELDLEVKVVRNNEISCHQIRQLAPQYLVFSPGPCTPSTAGVTLEAIKTFSGKIPILGVCLGHQAIGQVFGTKLIHASKVMHGKTSKIFHSQSKLFSNIDSPFIATRYHSLLLERESLPDCFNITAWCSDTHANEKLVSKKDIMAIEHKSIAVYGVQFHPESLLTENGHQILKNFINSQ